MKAVASAFPFDFDPAMTDVANTMLVDQEREGLIWQRFAFPRFAGDISRQFTRLHLVLWLRHRERLGWRYELEDERVTMWTSPLLVTCRLQYCRRCTIEVR